MNRDLKALQLFEQALELSDDQLVTFLDDACADDAGLRREVELLLSTHKDASDFLSTATPQKDSGASPFHLWAQQFDCPLDSNAISNLLHDILPRLEPQLIRAMLNDLRGEGGDLSSRQLLLQAMSVLTLKAWHEASFTEAANLWRRSIELEPNFAMTHVSGNQSVVAVELSHAPDHRIVWAERFDSAIDDVLRLRHTISGRIVTAIETRIQMAEAAQAVGSRPRIWMLGRPIIVAYGMYRFNREDNGIAAQMFDRAIQAATGSSFAMDSVRKVGGTPNLRTIGRERRL